VAPALSVDVAPALSVDVALSSCTGSEHEERASATVPTRITRTTGESNLVFVKIWKSYSPAEIVRRRGAKRDGPRPGSVLPIIVIMLSRGEPAPGAVRAAMQRRPWDATRWTHPGGLSRTSRPADGILSHCTREPSGSCFSPGANVGVTSPS
jgi:hypothetical protein